MIGDLGLFSRHWHYSSKLLLNAAARSHVIAESSRCFSTTRPVCIRKVKARPAPSKAKLAAKERKRALKAKKSVYEQEKMPLADAINVLRVRLWLLILVTTDNFIGLRLLKLPDRMPHLSW